MPTDPDVLAPQYLTHARPLTARDVDPPHEGGGVRLTAAARVPMERLPASGFATTNEFGKIGDEHLPTLPKGLKFRAAWDAATPAPALAPAPDLGDYLLVTAAGSTPLNTGPDAINDWTPGDLALWTSEEGGPGQWVKIDGGSRRVESVNGKKGHVHLEFGDVLGEGALPLSRFGPAAEGGDWVKLSSGQIPDGAFESKHFRTHVDGAEGVAGVAGAITGDHVVDASLSVDRLAVLTRIPLSALDETVARRDPGTDRIGKGDLPSDLIYKNSFSSFLSFQGDWDPATPPPSTTVNGGYFLVTAAGTGVLPGKDGPLDRWESGDLAVWLANPAEGAGFWVKIEAQYNVTSVNDKQGGVSLDFSDFDSSAAEGVNQLLGGKIAAGAVGATYQDGVAPRDHIPDGELDGAAKLALGSVGPDKLNGGIEGQKLKPGAVTLAKLGSSLSFGVSALPKAARPVSLWAPFAGGSTRIINYDCVLTMPTVYTEFPAGQFPRPYTCYSFKNVGEASSSMNTPDSSSHAVMGSICLKYTLPSNFTAWLGASLNMTTGAASSLTMTVYDTRDNVFTASVGGGQTARSRPALLGPAPSSEDAGAVEGATMTPCVVLGGQGFVAQANGTIKVVIECFPAPGETVEVDRLKLSFKTN
jgi:hypothetical protein